MTRPRSRLRRVLARCLVAIVAAGLPLAGGEIWARRTLSHVEVHYGVEVTSHSDPDTQWLIPGADVELLNNPISNRARVRLRVSSNGFRGPEVPAKREPGEVRVLVLGDSITFGFFLDEEETYPGRLEARLRASGCAARVINAGFGDSGTAEQMELLRARGLAVDPDVVVLGWYLNDSRPAWGFAKELGRRGWLRRHSVLADATWRQLVLRGWIAERGEDRWAWVNAARTTPWRDDHATFLRLAALARYDWGAAWDASSWDTIAAQLRDLRALAAGRFAVLVAVFPVAFQVVSSFVDDTPQKKMREICDQLGFAYVDLLPALRARGAAVFFDQCHLKPDGNDIAARAIAERLEADVLPALRKRP